MAGYQSLWEKVGVLVSANLNGLVDRALSMNSLAVFDEYLNRMRAELAALQSAEGFERGRIKTLTRQLAALERECDQYDQDVDRLLLREERELAAARQTMLNTKRGLMDQLGISLEEVKADVVRLTSIRTSLSADRSNGGKAAGIAVAPAAEARRGTAGPRDRQRDRLLGRLRLRPGCD